MGLALVWQGKALQAVVVVVVVEKLWQPVAWLGGAESRYEDRMSPRGLRVRPVGGSHGPLGLHGLAPGAVSRHLSLGQFQLSPQARLRSMGLTREEG